MTSRSISVILGGMENIALNVLGTTTWRRNTEYWVQRSLQFRFPLANSWKLRPLLKRVKNLLHWPLIWWIKRDFYNYHFITAILKSQNSVSINILLIKCPVCWKAGKKAFTSHFVFETEMMRCWVEKNGAILKQINDGI